MLAFVGILHTQYDGEGTCTCNTCNVTEKAAEDGVHLEKGIVPKEGLRVVRSGTDKRNDDTRSLIETHNMMLGERLAL